jgi:hypothetical protein
MTKPQTMVKIHRSLLILWAALLPLSLVLRESIFWVVFMSHYAIVVGHWSGWDASRAEDKVDNSQGESK